MLHIDSKKQFLLIYFKHDKDFRDISRDFLFMATFHTFFLAYLLKMPKLKNSNSSSPLAKSVLARTERDSVHEFCSFLQLNICLIIKINRLRNAGVEQMILFFNVDRLILYPHLALFASTCTSTRQALFSKIYFSYLGNKSKEKPKEN